MSFQLYYITDRNQIHSQPLDHFIAEAITAGVDWVQIREKDLPTRRLLGLTASAVEQARRCGNTRVMVNDRLDVALAAGAHGVHLGTRSMPPSLVRKLASKEFVVGASCHSLAEARAAQAGGADYILLGAHFLHAVEASIRTAVGIAGSSRGHCAALHSHFCFGGNHGGSRCFVPPERGGGNCRHPHLSG